jgi:hypothetical protein
MRGFFAALEDDEPVVTKQVQGADSFIALRKVRAALWTCKRKKGEEKRRGGDHATNARAKGGRRGLLRE